MIDRQEELGSGWAWLSFTHGAVAGLLAGIILPGMFAAAAASVTWQRPVSDQPYAGILTAAADALRSPLLWVSVAVAVLAVLSIASVQERLPALAGAILCSFVSSLLVLSFL